MLCAAQQADEADEAFAGTVPRMEVPAHARAGQVGRGHRFAAYPRCSVDTGAPEGTRRMDVMLWRCMRSVHAERGLAPMGGVGKGANRADGFMADGRHHGRRGATLARVGGGRG